MVSRAPGAAQIPKMADSRNLTNLKIPCQSTATLCPRGPKSEFPLADEPLRKVSLISHEVRAQDPEIVYVWGYTRRLPAPKPSGKNGAGTPPAFSGGFCGGEGPLGPNTRRFPGPVGVLFNRFPKLRMKESARGGVTKVEASMIQTHSPIQL